MKKGTLFREQIAARFTATTDPLRHKLAIFLLFSLTLPAFVCGLPFFVLDTLAQQSTTSPHTSIASFESFEAEIARQRGRLASSETETRRDALINLNALARPESSQVASEALNDRAAIVRATAVRAIHSLPSERVVALLTPVLSTDRDEFVRREAAYALGNAHDAHAVNSLSAALLQDKSFEVRSAAAVALGEIGNEEAASALIQALTRQISTSGLLNRIRRRTSLENEFVRRAATRSLGQIKSRQGVSVLISILENEHTEDDVRREAAEALGLIGDRSAVPALRALLTARDPYLARAAYEALLKIEPTQPFNAASSLE